MVNDQQICLWVGTCIIYHILVYVQVVTLPFADSFENFQSTIQLQLVTCNEWGFIFQTKLLNAFLPPFVSYFISPERTYCWGGLSLCLFINCWGRCMDGLLWKLCFTYCNELLSQNHCCSSLGLVVEASCIDLLCHCVKHPSSSMLWLAEICCFHS